MYAKGCRKTAAKLFRLCGRTKFMEWLRNGTMHLLNNSPAQEMIDKGYMISRLKKVKLEL
jgi:hypothetical protein